MAKHFLINALVCLGAVNFLTMAAWADYTADYTKDTAASGEAATGGLTISPVPQYFKPVEP